MRKPILLTIVMLLITSTGFCQMDDIAEAIKAKEKEMYEALKTGNMEIFEANLAEDFLAVGEQGIIDKAKEIENMSQVTMDSYELTDMRVMQPAEGVALLVYTANITGMYKEEAFDGAYHSTSAWVMNDDGTWQAIMHSSMQAAPMEEAVGMEEEMEME